MSLARRVLAAQVTDGLRGAWRGQHLCMGRAAGLHAVSHEQRFERVLGIGRGLEVELPSGNHLRVPDDQRWTDAGLRDHRGRLRHDASELERFVHQHVEHDEFWPIIGGGGEATMRDAAKVYLHCGCDGHARRLVAPVAQARAILSRYGDAPVPWS